MGTTLILAGFVVLLLALFKGGRKAGHAPPVGGPVRRKTAAELAGDRGESAVRELLAGAGFEAVHDTYVPTAGGWTQVDHCVRAGNALVALETKNWSGELVAFRGREWTLVSRKGRRIGHHSPTVQNLQHAKALRAAFGGWWHNVVVLVGDCRPPEGLEGVVPGDGLIAALEEIARRPVSAANAEANARAWEAMVAADAALDKPAVRQQHLAALADRHAA